MNRARCLGGLVSGGNMVPRGQPCTTTESHTANCGERGNDEITHIKAIHRKTEMGTHDFKEMGGGETGVPVVT